MGSGMDCLPYRIVDIDELAGLYCLGSRSSRVAGYRTSIGWHIQGKANDRLHELLGYGVPSSPKVISK